MDKISELKTWIDFKKGNQDALSRIYKENVDFLFSYGKKYTKDEQLILDVIQAIFCYIIERRNNLGDTDNIRLYLLKSFRRKLFSEFGALKKQESFHDEFEINIVFPIEETIIKKEESSQIELSLSKALKELNDKQREILYYKFSLNLGYEDICDILGISYNSARQMVSRSISILRKHMKKNGLILIFMVNRKYFCYVLK